MDIVNVNIFIIYDCGEIDHFLSCEYKERFYFWHRLGCTLNIILCICMKKKQTKTEKRWVITWLWLRGITVNLVRPNPDHHCLPTGETVNTLADIWGRLVCSESRVEVEAQMNLSDKCSWSMCCRLCFGEALDWDLSLTEAKQSMPDH